MTLSYSEFRRTRQQEATRTDWVAGIFGLVVRTVAYRKSGETDVATRLEHGLYILLAACM